MKPIKLTFKGINSFSEETVIDFEKLTKNGIFGIFGDTGSGKSTILDCINFALYGRVERSKEKLDIINYRCDGAEVEFEFDVLSDGKRRKYTVERSLKKKSGLHKAMLYEDGDCIADNATSVTKKITDILGVDAEDFRKCIALPQGEFSQFVKSQPSDRIALIERLFSLSRYGDRLKERLKVRESEAEREFSAIDAKLSLFSDVSEDIMKQLSGRIEALKADIDRLLKENAEAEKALETVAALGGKRAELDAVNEKLAALASDKKQMEELRSGLKAAPFCKTAVQTNGEIISKSDRVASLNEKLAALTSSYEAEKAKVKELEAYLQTADFEKRIADCITLAAKYSSCEGKAAKLAALEDKLLALRTKFRVKEDELAKLKKAQVQEEENVRLYEKKLEDSGAKNLDDLVNVRFKGAVLKEEYVNTLDYFTGLNGQIKIFDDRSELYKFIERELKTQIAVYRDRVYQVKDFSIEEARKQLKLLQTADKEREKLNAQLNEKKTALQERTIAVNGAERDLQDITREGGELRKQADEIKSELERAFGAECKNYQAAERTNAQNLENLRAEQKKISNEMDCAVKRMGEISAQSAATQAEKKNAEEELVRLKAQLEEAVKKSGLNDFESCKTLAAEFAKFADAEKALEQYDSKIISLTARLEELKKTDGIVDFSTRDLTAARENKNSKTQALNGARENYAVLLSEYNKSAERLKEKELLTKDYKRAERERDLIARLKEVTKGNKFMEYIANEYLYDISALASSTLLDLTDGRYFLTYTDTFYAGDNFNCGNLRGVNTLSGGETFLVSLSLALALSQTICSSLKSIEFFFLDEGFGTLDGALVDTVMNALEKLKSSRFTIGVISHVEELKHRIDSKITVNKATESHGSYVSISC